MGRCLEYPNQLSTSHTNNHQCIRNTEKGGGEGRIGGDGRGGRKRRRRRGNGGRTHDLDNR